MLRIRRATPSVAVLLFGALVVGCEKRDTTLVSPSAHAVEVVGPTAYVSLSDDAPEVGSTVTVVGNAVRTDGGGAFGSFKSHLNYDRSRLAFVGELPLGASLRATNPDTISGRVTVAGASIGGFVDGKLFALQFRVLKPRPFDSLSLVVDELNGVDYVNQLRSLVSRPKPQLDRSLR